MDPGFGYNLYFIKDESEVGSFHRDSSLETDISSGVTRPERLLYFPEAFYSRPANEGGLGAAEQEPGEADADIGQVRYHPGYLSLYLDFAVCVRAARRGTGVFHPLRSFAVADSDGTTMWQTEAVHPEPRDTSRQFYLIDKVIYTVQTYASSRAIHFGDVLPFVAIQSPVGREATGLTTVSTSTSTLTRSLHSRTFEVGETHIRVDSAPSLSIDLGGSSSRDSDEHDEAPRSISPGNSNGKDQAPRSISPGNSNGKDQASCSSPPVSNKREEEASGTHEGQELVSNLLSNSGPQDEAPGSNLPRRSDQPDHSFSSNLSDTVDEKQGEFEAEADAVKLTVGDSARTPLQPSSAFDSQLFQTCSSALSSSGNGQTSENISATSAEEVMLERVVDLGMKKSTENVLCSLQHDIPTSPPGIGIQRRDLHDVSSEIAHSLPYGESEGHIGNVVQHLSNEVQEASSHPTVDSQEHEETVDQYLERISAQTRGVVSIIAYRDPYRIQQPEEKGVVTPEEFTGDFLNEELWPALPIPKGQPARTTVLSNNERQASARSLPSKTAGPDQESGTPLPTNSDREDHPLPTNCQRNPDGQDQVSESNLPERSDQLDQALLTDLPDIAGEKRRAFEAHADTVKSMDGASAITPLSPSRVSEGKLVHKIGSERRLEESIAFKDPYRIHQLEKEKGAVTPEEFKGLLDEELWPALPTAQDHAARTTLGRNKGGQALASILLSKSVGPDQTAGTPLPTNSRHRKDQVIPTKPKSDTDGQDQASGNHIPGRSDQLDQTLLTNLPDIGGEKRIAFEAEADAVKSIEGASAITLSPSRASEGKLVRKIGAERRLEESIAFKDPYRIHQLEEEKAAVTPEELKGFLDEELWPAQDRASGTPLPTNSRHRKDQAVPTSIQSDHDGHDQASGNNLSRNADHLDQVLLTDLPHTAGEKRRGFEADTDAVKSLEGASAITPLSPSRASEGVRKICAERRLEESIAFRDPYRIHQLEKEKAAVKPEEFKGLQDEELWPALPIALERAARTTLRRNNKGEALASSLPSRSAGPDQGSGTPLRTNSRHRKDQAVPTNRQSDPDGQDQASGNNLSRKADQLDQALLTDLPDAAGEKRRGAEADADTVKSVERTSARTPLSPSRAPEWKLVQKIDAEKKVEESIAFDDPYSIQRSEKEKAAVKPEEFKGLLLDEQLWPALRATHDEATSVTLRNKSEFEVFGTILCTSSEMQASECNPLSNIVGQHQASETRLTTNSDRQDQVVLTDSQNNPHGQDQASGRNLSQNTDQADHALLTDILNTVGENALAGTHLSPSMASEMKLIQKIEAQRRVEESVAYKYPYSIKQPEKEEAAVAPVEIRGDFLDGELWPALSVSQGQAARSILPSKSEFQVFGTTLSTSSQIQAWESIVVSSSVGQDQASGTPLPINNDRRDPASGRNLTRQTVHKDQALLTDFPNAAGEKRRVFESDVAKSLEGASARTLPASRTSEGKPVPKIGAERIVEEWIGYRYPKKEKEGVTGEEFQGDLQDEVLWPALPNTPVRRIPSGKIKHRPKGYLNSQRSSSSS